VTSPMRTVHGSIEGTVEAINVHQRTHYFSLYDSLTTTRVRCNFGAAISLDLVKGALRRRAVVYGLVGYRPSGRAHDIAVEAIDIAVEAIDILPEDADLPTAAQVRGIIPKRPVTP